ncbi:sialoadhesin-like [Myxocyprinus asiaticus]|uniref:sialoadhesin-like n=1 Tax=Myxocyprinus asiaticus TaxID=70543 RepID=UPI0022213D54|nr:sialoadhesin-like [Myxocyprinus asiaticus]
MTMVSYVLKKGKAVVLLSTMHDEKAVDDNSVKKKPEVIQHYNKNKGEWTQWIRWFAPTQAENTEVAHAGAKHVLRIQPDEHVFRGETVTLTCDIQGETHTEWRYSWIKDGHIHSNTSTPEFKISSVYESDSATPKPIVTVSPQNSVFTGDTITLRCEFTHSTGWTILWSKNLKHINADSAQTGTLSDVKVSNGGKYHCRAQRGNYYTHYSHAAVITVTERPKPVVKITPDHHVFRGETVTLTCDIQRETHTEWRYSWFKDGLDNPVSTERVYRITSDKSHSGKYSCRGERKQDSQRSDISDALLLTVSGQWLPVSLIISPSRSQHFSSHSLSLSCEDHNNSTGWTVRRNTDSERMKDCSSTGSTCKISSLKTSDTGVYWCQSQSGENSQQINITVHDGDVILESSVHPVIEGDTLTLHCLHRSTNSSNLTADFYKDGSLLQNQTTGEMSIPTVSKSHEGFYSCKHGERGQSPESWISVTDSSDQISVLHTLSSLLAVCPYLIVTVVLVFKCYRARVSSVEDQSQYAVTEEETSI